MGTLGTPWDTLRNPLEHTQEILGNPFETLGDPSTSLKTLRKPLRNPWETLRKPFENPLGTLGNPSKICGNPLETLGSPFENPLETLRKPMGILRAPLARAWGRCGAGSGLRFRCGVTQQMRAHALCRTSWPRANYRGRDDSTQLCFAGRPRPQAVHKEITGKMKLPATCPTRSGQPKAGQGKQSDGYASGSPPARASKRSFSGSLRLPALNKEEWLTPTL